MSTYEVNQSRSLAVSEQALLNVRLPGTVISTEYQTTELMRWLDRLAGVDAIIRTPEDTVYGLALRNQFVDCGNNPFNTFTVRYKLGSQHKTEYEKRMNAIQSRYLFYPQYTIQCYFDESGSFLSGAKMKTKDLYQYMADYDYAVNDEICREDGHVFLYSRWSHILRTGFDIFITGSVPQ